MVIQLRDDADSGVSPDGLSWWRRSGEDTGPGGYRCRWTVTGGGARDGSRESKETWWEKADESGFKELGAEKSGFNDAGDAWWETWREVYRPGPGGPADTDVAQRPPPGATLEKSADKWARDKEGREWHEQWWEKYSAGGGCEKGARKSGRAAPAHAWWETWGEVHSPSGGALKWTDKWAESGAPSPSGVGAARWGDKWEERFDAGGAGTKQGETWRVSASGERWSRTWGETHAAAGSVRKFGRSTSGEAWDNTAPAEGRYTWERPLGWADVVATAAQLLAIETPRPSPPPPAQSPRMPPPPQPGGAWAAPSVVVPPPPPSPPGAGDRPTGA